MVSDPTSAPGQPTREQAEALVESARQSGDRRAEAEALTDLASVLIFSKDLRTAEGVLTQALQLMKGIDDPARGAEIAGQLGTVVVSNGQMELGLEMLQWAVAQTSKMGDRFGEKLALERLGLAVGRLNPALAVTHFENAIAIARELGDRSHEANLLWFMAIRLAELGRRDEAIAAGELMVARLKELGNPREGWYADHLSRYRSADRADVLGGAIVSSATSGPGLLAMALSAGKAMANFLGGGLKTVSPEVRRDRLAICQTCEHHTGLRCRLCGCFTAAKTWLPYEGCPIGKWPRASGG